MTKRTFGQRFGFPFYEGAGVETLAPYVFPVALGSFPYNLDYKVREFHFASVPYVRQQSDQSDSPGEHSLDPTGLWRRSAASWHLGAGQDRYDRPNYSSEFRFRSSLGMDIWTIGELKLHKDTDAKIPSANTNLKVVVAGTHLYFLDGTNLRFTTDINVDTPTFTALTGTPPTNAATSIVSDGFNVFTAHGTQGIFKTTRGTAAWAGAAHITGTVSVLGMARGRVLAANANSVYDITSIAQGGGGALPTALFTHNNTDFKWTAFAEGRNAVYMAGYSGDKSLIYKSTIKSDGTGLDAPVVAGELPDGEQIESLYGYLGPFFFIGSGGLPGWRFSLVNQNGDLNIGSRVKTPNTVLAFEGQENFVWFGYTGYNSTHTGLGRINIAAFGDPDGLVPAYASDLMVLNQTAAVTSVVTFQNIRVFTVNAVGVYAQHHLNNLVSVGTLDTGEITYNMNEDKIGLFVDVTHHAHVGGTHSMWIAVDNGSFVSLGTHMEHTASFIVGEKRARSFELRIQLDRDSVTATVGQTLTSWLLRSQIVPSISTTWRLPLLISDTVYDLDGNPHYYSPFAQLQNIADLCSSKAITQLKVNNKGYSVVIENYDFNIESLTLDSAGIGFGFNATCIIDTKVITEAV